MPSTDGKLELKAKTSVAQTASQAAVYAKGLIVNNSFVNIVTDLYYTHSGMVPHKVKIFLFYGQNSFANASWYYVYTYTACLVSIIFIILSHHTLFVNVVSL
jgi:hypothetical protein